ncbi:MAG: hypothetical protein RL516_1815 [Bacteroidota bacterium]|jgi:hypothetical protein
MSNKEIELLKEKIKHAIRLSSLKLVKKKRDLGLQLVISEKGQIKTINP